MQNCITIYITHYYMYMYISKHKVCITFTSMHYHSADRRKRSVIWGSAKSTAQTSTPRRQMV